MARLPTLLALTALLVATSAQSATDARVESTDACSLATADEIRPVLTLRPLELRSRMQQSRDGRACIWGAYDEGLVTTAPAEYEIGVRIYRIADADRAATMFDESWHRDVVPSLVRTAGQGDQVARPDEDKVAVRHGGVVVVIDASRQQQEVLRAADRVYRLEALAFKMSGATVLGPIDPSVTKDACSSLPKQHALNVLTLEPSSLRIDHDGRRCTMSVKDGSGNIGHWTQNHGEVQVTRRDLGTNAAALAFQHAQTPFLPISTLVQTADAGDRLVTNADRPEEAWAVHGANYVELFVSDPTAAVKATPGWAYRVQRMALEAAGATIIPPADAPPEPVVPGPLPADRGMADTPWTPPAHPAPRQSALFDPIIAVIATLAGIRFFLLPVMIIGPALIAGFWPSGAQRPGRPPVRRATLIVVCVLFAVSNLIFGPQLATWLVYHAGASGGATVTASHATSTQYNNHDVRSHTVLIRTVDDKVIEAGFRNDDFNVFPIHNRTVYPGRGDAFTVRYLEHDPTRFVIVADDDSPWARMLRCDGLEASLADARAKARFAPDSQVYKAAYDRAFDAAKSAQCAARR